MEMLVEPDKHRFPQFAGQRLRMAEAIVVLDNRVPRDLVRLIYPMLTFDERGGLDLGVFMRQQAAHVDLVLGEVLPHEAGGPVIDASSQFIAQGGQWRPSLVLELRIRATALGKTQCRRL
jgi:hypothetical protein